MNIYKSLSRIARKTGIVITEHAPQILLGLGIGCSVGGIVLAVKETPAAQKVMEDAEIDLAKLHGLKDQMEEDGGAIEFQDQETGDVEIYDKKAYTKDLVKFYVETGIKLGKIYAPAIVTESAAIASILGSHGIMRNRNAALATSLLTTEKAFKKYRDRVIEDHGKEYDRDVTLGIRRGEVEVPVYKKNGEVKTDKDGVVKTEMKEDITFDGLDENSFWFDSSSHNFNKNGNLLINNDFLYDIHDHFNKLLKIQGYIHVNDILHAVGLPVTEYGANAGWIYDPHGDILGAPQDFVDIEWWDQVELAGNATPEQQEKFNNEHGAILVQLRPMSSNINPYLSEVCYPMYPRED